ncbi:Protoporphyrinogen oxidase [Sphaceloma murrayae]|uniref:Protoporphyrinogen oxidase n=1 Tax=Sphaceloma murrayae TaxID=2082308 RepID=A0A2K1QI29_9PEZI|nr:Protoporphyrinogen oxidase [Sphaceloma murrayae]
MAVTKTKQFEVAIIGGGIAGLTLAIALHYRNVPFVIYEQAPAFGEIGAGVSFSPNAVQAMKKCHTGVYEAFEKVCTRNVWPSKRKVWFDYLDSYCDGADPAGGQPATFTISNELGQNGVHRARYLDELVKMLPQSAARFGKRLNDVQEMPDGKLLMTFEDGTAEYTDAVIGCDGIKSRVRRFVVGDDHPSTLPSYTHKYAYRGLVPMKDAIAAIGEERALNACMHMGYDGHVLTFPVDHGSVLNIVAFRTTSEDWPDPQRLTRQGQRSDLLKDFENYRPEVKDLLRLTKPDLDVWAIYDLGDNPLPFFHKNRICVVGDAAHATSPHHGAGAGFCIEDSAILAELLADERITEPQQLSHVFAAFDEERRERGQWLVQSSRRIGDCYEWRAEGVGRDYAKIEAEINERNGIIANVDFDKLCSDAKTTLGRLITV